jgi:hypothetical protein
MTGASGVGVRNTTNGSATITSTSFSGLDTAIDVDAGGTVDVRTSTISGCGKAGSLPAINVDNITTSVIILNNTITDSVDEILQVANVGGLGGKVFMNFNTITAPAKGIDNQDSSVKVDATNNLWDGGVAPAVSSTNATTSPHLVGPVSNAQIATNTTTLNAKSTSGVMVGTSAAANAILAANYASNPGTAAVPGIASKYYDVYASGTPGNTTITLYGDISSSTTAYVWGAGLGSWIACSSQSVNVFAGSITISITATSIPSTADLIGLPFAISDPDPMAATVAAPTIVSPVPGTDDADLSPTVFDWSPVAGATSYEFQLSPNAEFVAPLLVDRTGDGSLIVTEYGYNPDLEYSKAYYFRVRAVNSNGVKSTWASGVFVTMDEPEEPTPPVVIEENPPPQIVVESPDVVLPAATPITPAWIYVIIAVGGVLIIALIVLIVRTRRVA